MGEIDGLAGGWVVVKQLPIRSVASEAKYSQRSGGSGEVGGRRGFVSIYSNWARGSSVYSTSRMRKCLSWRGRAGVHQLQNSMGVVLLERMG